MNIFGVFRNLYNNLFNKNQVNSTEVVNLVDTLIIPKRENLSEQYVKMLDTFKSEYVDKLRHRVLFSGDLDIDGVRQDMDMNIELLRDILSKEVGTSIFSVVNSETVDTMQVNYMVRASKMELYLDHILELEREVKLRILALDEILKEKVFFSLIKKNAIRNKLDNLRFLGHVFQNQVFASINEIKASIKEMETLQFTKDLDDCSEEVSSKMMELLSMLNVVAPDKCEEVKVSEFTSPYLKMAYIERELELYVYNHKNDVQVLEREVRNYTVFYPFYSYDEVKSLSDSLENKLRVFYEYGKDLVSKELLFLFYSKKFECISHMFWRNSNYNIHLSTNINYIELEFYTECVMNIIQKIITYSDMDAKEIKLFTKALKNNNNEYDFYDILTSKKIFLVLSLDHGCINNFFDNFRFEKSEFDGLLNFYEDVFGWEDELSFDALNMVIQSEQLEDKFPLFKFYNYYKSKRNSDSKYFSLPNGITRINIKEDETNPILSYIRNNAKGKTVVTPESLKEISGPWLKDVSIENLYLERGLEKLGSESLPNKKFRTLIVHSSIKEVSTDMGRVDIETLIFDHYDEADILGENSWLLKDFIKVFFEVKSGKVVDNVYNHPASQGLDRIVKTIIREGIVFRSWNDEVADICILSDSLEYSYIINYLNNQEYSSYSNLDIFTSHELEIVTENVIGLVKNEKYLLDKERVLSLDID